MAIPNSKITLKEYCLRTLGKGAVDINVTDDQADDRLDEALQYFSHYYYDGIEKMYLKYKITAADITEYHIRGLWYFDKRQAEMKYRLIGIAPVAPDVNFIEDENPDLVPLFWIFFPDARGVLHEAKAFNNENSSIPFSFDHILNSRRFQGYIFKEEND